jgi:hypothetical protein
MFAEPADFILKPSYFRHQSWLHGVNHTYRVMCNVLMIGNELGMVHEKRLAFCAAFVHDMSRRHDGFSLRHGPRAAGEKVPEFEEMFLRNGASPSDIDGIKSAVANHSQYTEPDKTSAYYAVTAILKDADALDRIRMGEGNLNTKYLRYEVSAQLIPVASQLFFDSNNRGELSFDEMFDIAAKIYGHQLLY